MKNNGAKDKCQLRRQQLINKQNRVAPMGKKSLGRRIIAERAKGITAKNIEDECERLGCIVKSDEILAQIMYHIKFGRDARPYTFNDDMIVGILDRIKELEVKLSEGVISAKEHVEYLEEIDSQIIEQINNWEHWK